MTADNFPAHLRDKKWLFVIGFIIVIVIVLVAAMSLPEKHSVSNLYIIPAGTFSPSPVAEQTYENPPGSPFSLPPVPRFYRDTLPAGVGRQWIDLSWANLNNPRTIVVYAPDTTLGPFRNADNGFVDQRIFLEIAADGNLTAGQWYYQVQADGTVTNNDTFRIYRDKGTGEA